MTNLGCLKGDSLGTRANLLLPAAQSLSLKKGHIDPARNS